jgi:hypothetical protein
VSDYVIGGGGDSERTTGNYLEQVIANFKFPNIQKKYYFKSSPSSYTKDRVSTGDIWQQCAEESM